MTTKPGWWSRPPPGPLPDAATVKASIEELRSWLGMTQKWADDLFTKTERARSEIDERRLGVRHD